MKLKCRQTRGSIQNIRTSITHLILRMKADYFLCTSQAKSKIFYMCQNSIFSLCCSVTMAWWRLTFSSSAQLVHGVSFKMSSNSYSKTQALRSSFLTSSTLTELKQLPSCLTTRHVSRDACHACFIYIIENKTFCKRFFVCLLCIEIKGDSQEQCCRFQRKE